VQDHDARRLTCIEKTNTFQIDEIQFLQIQDDWRFAALNFGFELIQVPNSKFAAKPNPPLAPFNPQRHFLSGSGKTVMGMQAADRLQWLAAFELRVTHRPDFSGIRL
jgi:hypothetical protein